MGQKSPYKILRWDDRICFLDRRLRRDDVLSSELILQKGLELVGVHVPDIEPMRAVLCPMVEGSASATGVGRSLSPAGGVDIHRNRITRSRGHVHEVGGADGQRGLGSGEQSGAMGGQSRWSGSLQRVKHLISRTVLVHLYR